jgi:hypothetical protein
MGGFIPLPSPSNPSLAAADAPDPAYAYNARQSRIAQAANQQAQQQQQQANAAQRLATQNAAFGANAIYHGAIPKESITAVGAPGSSGVPGKTLLKRGDNPDVPAQGKGQTFSDASGKQYYMATQEEQGKAIVPVGELNNSLKALGYDGKTPITGTMSHALMQTANELAKQQEDEGYAPNPALAGKLQYDGQPIIPMFGKKTGRMMILNTRTGESQTPEDYVAGQIAGAPPAQSPTVPTGGLQDGLAQAAQFAPIAAQAGLSPFTAQPAAQPVAPTTPGRPDGAFTAQPPAAPTQSAQPSQRGAAKGGGGITFAPPEKAEPTDQQVILGDREGPNGEMAVYDKKTQTIKLVPVPQGTKGRLTPEQQQIAARAAEADADRHVRMAEQGTAAAGVAEARTARTTAATQALENKAAQDHEKAGAKKEAMQGMAQGFWDAAAAQPGKPYNQPRYVNGVVVQGPAALMPEDKDEAAAKQAELKKMAVGFEKTAKTHQNEQERIEKQHGWGKFAAPQAAQQQPPAQGAQPAQQGAAKVFPRARLNEYAQKNKITPAAAESALNSQGWKVQ